VGYGAEVSDEINVIIEIPAHSDPVKYDFDKETGAMFVDRFMSTAMRYLCDYGYVPHTPVFYAFAPADQSLAGQVQGLTVLFHVHQAGNLLGKFAHFRA